MERVPRAVTLRAMLAVALLAGFYMFGLLLFGCLVWIAVELFTAFGGTVGHDLGYGAGALLVAIAWPLWQFARAGEEPPMGAPVSERQAPELWATVRELAAAVGTRVPDEIRLYPEVNAAVQEDAGRVGLRRGRRYLYLGVPLLRSLTVPQIRAVLAHELGHYAGGHTVFGAVAYRGGQSITRTLKRIGPHRAAGLLLGAYAALYFLVAMTVLRRMEVEADAAAARAAGVDATREALTTLTGLVGAWDVAIDSWVRAARDRGVTQDEALNAYDAQVAYEAQSLDGRLADGERAEEAAAGGVGTPWDSHPPLAERLRLLAELAPDPAPSPVPDSVPWPRSEVVAEPAVLAAAPRSAPSVPPPFDEPAMVDGPVAVEDRAAIDDPAAVEDRPMVEDPSVAGNLVADPGAVFAALAEDRFVDVLAAAARAAADVDADALFAACRQALPGASREGLGLVLDVLSVGRGEDVASALAADVGEEPADSDAEAGDEPDAAAVLAENVSLAIGAQLVFAGLARWDFGWSRPLVLRSTGDDEPVVPDVLVADACGDREAVGRLREYLRGLGVDEATTAPWAIRGWRALDPGELPSALPGSERLSRLLLPDELLMLIRAYAGRNPPTSDTLRAGVSAAVLAELRLRGRLAVAGDRSGMVYVRDAQPTGEPFLDGVLARIGAGGQQPAYRWLQLLGRDVYATAGDRLGQLQRRWVYNDTGRLVFERAEDGMAERVRRDLSDALRAGESDSHAALLGMLLWATEASRPVLGRSALAHRFWLGRQAARDPLMVAVRTVTGLHTDLPRPTGIYTGM
ncbi:GPP34 family phosphoprotein [Rugosimonospora africana]|uniref:Peptidase M48 domain-containing protein n=1 Tax=Rugosimonospora africana TaxID=556532 RepID=A0A8J3QRU4_9ACTN|nr:GPP34 family phosphoprotein [Rugosimonospora africana]GIH14393.1 hypothetical protein Raf01_25650 [Rugosimonospora africana]